MRIVGNPQVRRNVRVLRSQARTTLARIRFGQRYPLGADEWALLCPHGIGDTYLACGLAEALLATHGGRSVTAFVKPQHRHVASLFPSVGRVVEVAGAEGMWEVGERGLSPGVPFYAHFSPDLMSILGHRGLTLLDGYRGLLQVPMDAALSAPRRPTEAEADRAQDLFEGYGLPVGRTTVLAPEANSCGEFDSASWRALADALWAGGWHPITNAGPKGHVVPGAASVEVPLDLCVPFVERAGWIITMRSGLADLVSSAATRLSVLYPTGPWLAGTLYEAASLVAMGLSDQAEEFEIDPEGFQDTIPRIVTGPIRPALCIPP